ncbi:MAG TPA: HlyD family efflux transporter periplasmic adaptor subunit [Chloroflexi bacterium]|nr:HlyD family efflux transporter periplasmic adaptor subunit [Chloroflexota bacterium]
MNRKRILAIGIVVLLVAGIVGAGFYFSANPAVWQDILTQVGVAKAESDGLTASGFIEAEEVTVAPELGGRVTELLIEEGEEVEAGQVLVILDSTLLDAQVEIAQAALEMTEAELAQAKAGVREERIRRAEAELAQAQAGRDGAYQAWQDLLAIRDNPQDLKVQIAQAEAQAAAAEAGLAQAVAMKDAAEIAHENFWDAKEELSEAREEIEELEELCEEHPYLPMCPPPSLPGMPLDFHLIPNNYWKAWVGVNAAQAGLDGARAALGRLYAMRDNPQQLNAQIDAAKTEYRAAETAVAMAEAQLEALQAGATAEEIAIVEAQVDQAKASLNSLLVQRKKQTIAAPVSGVVLGLSIHEGELAAPGRTMLTLGNLDEVMLTIYVPVNKLGWVRIGQTVEVQVDSFPNRVFEGVVLAIADKAEFTPRNVQTQEERVNMVFAVDVSIPNPDHALMPGVPADAVIITEEQ